MYESYAVAIIEVQEKKMVACSDKGKNGLWLEDFILTSRESKEKALELV